MTLGFMQTWPKEMAMTDHKTYFIEKINLGLLQAQNTKQIDYVEYLEDYRTKFGDNWDCKTHLKPKPHTIRADEHNRWKAGMNIHFVVNSRSKDRFQFAPVVPVVSVQTIEIREMIMTVYDCIKLKDGRVFTVQVDGKHLPMYRIVELSDNDGFETVEDFFKYFKDDFKGKLIHWTKLKY